MQLTIFSHSFYFWFEHARAPHPLKKQNNNNLPLLDSKISIGSMKQDNNLAVCPRTIHKKTTLWSAPSYSLDSLWRKKNSVYGKFACQKRQRCDLPVHVLFRFTNQLELYRPSQNLAGCQNSKIQSQRMCWHSHGSCCHAIGLKGEKNVGCFCNIVCCAYGLKIHVCNASLS